MLPMWGAWSGGWLLWRPGDGSRQLSRSLMLAKMVSATTNSDHGEH